MELEVISINLMTKTLNHATSSEATKLELNKKTIFKDALAYINDYCTKKGFEILTANFANNAYIYHLIKK